MTVLDIESPSRETSVLPFERPRHLPPQSRPLALFCPNTANLPINALQKAEHLLSEMAEALNSEDVETFNESRQLLTHVIKKHGEPITQWNPLILELTHPDALQGKKLPNINLTMTSLRCPVDKVSLVGAGLQSACFLCADLTQTVLADADLSGADLRFADLREIRLDRALLVEADLGNAKLSGAVLDGANLYCAKLSNALVKQASLQEANLRRADLRNADLYQANLRSVRLQRSDLREANLFMANMDSARLRQADLRKANLGFANLRETRVQGARLGGAALTSADLSAADLQRCCCEGVTFGRAVLSSANLSQARLHSADLSEATELDKARLEGAQFDGDTRFPKGFKPRKHALIDQQFHGLRRFKVLLSRLTQPKPETPDPLAR